MQRSNKRGEHGITSIEVAFGVSIAALVLIFSMHAITQFINVGRTVSEKTKAIYLAEEGLELLRFVRDDAWANLGGLALNTTYYVDVTPTNISVTTTPQYIDGYVRSFSISNVYRNASDDIVASTTGGAVADPRSKYVTMVVRWGTPTSSIMLSSILTEIDI